MISLGKYILGKFYMKGYMVHILAGNIFHWDIAVISTFSGGNTIP